MPHQTHHNVKYSKPFVILSFVISGLIMVILVGLVLLLLRRSSCDRLTCIDVSGSTMWKEQEVYEHSVTSYRALLTGPSLTIRAEKHAQIIADDAALLTKVTVMQVTGLFDDARSPYPGMVSDRIRCDTVYKPDIQHLKNGVLDITYYAAYLNNRLQYGSCLDNQLPYKGYTAMFYCPDHKAWYHLEFIRKREDANDNTVRAIVETISCRTPRLGIP